MGKKKQMLNDFAVYLKHEGLLKDMAEKPDDSRSIAELVKDFRRLQK